MRWLDEELLPENQKETTEGKKCPEVKSLDNSEDRS